MNKISPTVLLLGGGYVLKKVADILEPNTFLITSRSPETVSEFRQNGWLAEECDTLEPSQLSGLVARFPTLTTVIDSVPPCGDPSKIESSIEATKRTHAMSEINRAIYLSTTGVYGVDDGSWVSETTVINPQHPRSLDRVNFEESYQRTFSESCLLRIPAIYGPGRGIGNSLKLGRYPLIGGGERWSNRIHVADLARAIVLMIKMKKIPAVLCVSDSEPTPSIDVINFYCKTFHLSFPNSISYEEAKSRGLHTMLSNQRVSSKFLREDLNFTLNYPTFREGAATEFLSD